MINTAPPASNSVYCREKLFWYDNINYSNHVCHCRAVVKELLARADKPGSTPGDAVFCFFVRFFCFVLFCFVFFFCLVFFFHTIFPFGHFFFILTADPADHKLGWIYILSSSPELYFGQRDFKSSWSAYWPRLRPDKNYKLSRHVPPLKQLNFFSTLVDIMTNNTQHNTNCTNLHPTPTSDPLAKV